MAFKNFMGHRRRRRCVDGQSGDLAAVDLGEKRRQAVDVHRLVQTVADGFFDQRMIRQRHTAAAVVLAHHLFGKHRREQIFGAHALDRHWDFFAAVTALERQCPGRVPTPAVGKHRRRQHRLS